jgi:Holliday junction DNA helicase RuvA
LIGRLTGRIVEEGEGGALCVDVAGVGYEVLAPLGTRGRASRDGSDLVTLHVHTHVREDALQLFAFASVEERDAFRTLISISNVGPKLGLAVLSAISIGDLGQAVARGEAQKLVAIPGVGKKTAERLILELKGKLLAPPPAGKGTPGTAPVAAAGSGSQAELLGSALTRLGYRPAEAERVVTTLAASRDLEAFPLGDLVREALALLSK